MMFDVEDFLKECYNEGEISIEQLKEITDSEKDCLRLWEDYVASFQRPHVTYIVKRAADRTIKFIEACNAKKLKITSEESHCSASEESGQASCPIPLD